MATSARLGLMLMILFIGYIGEYEVVDDHRSGKSAYCLICTVERLIDHFSRCATPRTYQQMRCYLSTLQRPLGSH